MSVIPNILSKITGALLAVLLIYIIPLLQAGQREEDIQLLSSYNTLVQFSDAVRNKGYLSPQMYEDFATELGRLGVAYEIELEHRSKKYHPEYDDYADPTTFLNRFEVHYDAYYSGDVLKVLYPEGNAQLSNSNSISNRKYKLKLGDFFTVTVRKVSKSTYEVLGSFLYSGEFPKGQAVLTYGGMVLNEDY